MSSPCKVHNTDCPNREIGCHTNCQKYLDWAAEVRAERINTNIEKANLDKMWNYGWRGGKKKK